MIGCSPFLRMLSAAIQKPVSKSSDSKEDEVLDTRLNYVATKAQSSS
jgi:hypothetical protein